MIDRIYISIAGFVVELVFNHSRLVMYFSQRYADFLTSPTTQKMVITIDWTQPKGDGLYDNFVAMPVDFRVSGDRAFCDLPSYHADLDLKRSIGSLQIESVNPIDGIEYFLRVAMAFYLFDHGAILFHGAGLVRDGLAYVFFGKSGSGKTTVARLSRDAVVLNDDLVAFARNQVGWQVYATPFTNPTQVPPEFLTAPLKSLYRLVQAQDVWLEPLSPSQGLAELVANVPVISINSNRSKDLMALCTDLALTVGVSNLHFLEDDTFWGVILDEQ